MQLDCKINLKIKKFHQHIINITKPIEQLILELLFIFVSPKIKKKDVYMNVRKRDLRVVQNLNCSKFNSKQKQDYEKWLKEFVKPLSEKELNEMEKEKTKTFEDFFPVDTVTRFYVNKMDYNPLLGA